jgi:hypothetical protein
MPGIDRSIVINTALRRIAAAGANLPTGGASPANALAQAAYPSVLRKLLAEYDWSFATEYKRLSRLTSGPLFGWKYAYQIPSSCIRIVDVYKGVTYEKDGETKITVDMRHPETRYAISGRKIYTYSDPCMVRMVATGHDSEAHEPFVDALACLLACELAPAVSQNGTASVQMLLQMYSTALDAARTFDAGTQRDMQHAPTLESGWIRERFREI